MAGLKYTKEVLESLAKECVSVSQICQRLGIQQSGSSNTHIKSRLLKYEIDTSHFLGCASNRGKTSSRKKHWSEHLTVRSKKDRAKTKTLRRALTEAGRKYECAKCHNDGTWSGQKLILEVDHINECGWDNRLENLQYLCPNCHSQKTLGE